MTQGKICRAYGFVAVALIYLTVFFGRPGVVAAQDAGVLFACVNPSGLARFVKAGTLCPPNETLVSWNVVGPEGPAGSPGPAGTSGGGTVSYVVGGMFPGTSVARAFCPPGTKVTGGGGVSLSGAGLQQDYPISDATGVIAFGTTAIGWQIAASDFSDVQAFVACLGP